MRAKHNITMITHLHRVAIARILSDLIRSDKIIERSEILLYNHLQHKFGITQKDRIEAQSTTITDAMNCVRELDNDAKQQLQEALLQTANADNQCVAREALILLALKYILEDTDGKYELLSCDTHGSYIEDKFMVYIESDEQEDLNDDIQCNIDAICDKMHLWNFDFIYIPHITQKMKHMDADYIKDIIRYMKPMFNDETVDALYNNLTHITTENFTTELLGAQMNMPTLREAAPSLLINFGTSIVPYCATNHQGHTYTDFLRIRIDDNTSVLQEITRFISDYGNFITDREMVRPATQDNFFKYFGFYKALFDFLAQTDGSTLIDRKVVIDLRHRSLRICGRDVKLSPTQLTTYVLILLQSIRSYGLPHLRTKAQLAENAKLCSELTNKYRKVYSAFSSVDNKWVFEENTKNIAANISHIRKKMQEQAILSPDVYLPYQKSIEGIDYYCTNINIENIYVLESGGEDGIQTPLSNYRPWK